MPRIAVIDLSHHNMVMSLKAAKAAGVVGVIHKATESTAYADPMYEARRALAKEAGLLWGAYHFLRRDQVSTQLAHFLRVAQPDENTLMACDYEDATVSLGTLVDFMTTLDMKLGGAAPVLYCGNVLKEKLGTKPVEILSQYRLWLAQYGPTPHPPAGWTQPWLWQYSDGNIGPTPHTVPGIGPVDCDHYAGTDDQLRAEWAGGSKSAVVQPAPRPPLIETPVVKIAIQVPAGVRVDVTQT